MSRISTVSISCLIFMEGRLCGYAWWQRECTSSHLHLFKAERQYFLKSSTITFFYVYLNDYEKIPKSEIVSNEGHFDKNMCVINLSAKFWPYNLAHLVQVLRCLFIYTYQIHVSSTVNYFKYIAFHLLINLYQIDM